MTRSFDVVIINKKRRSGNKVDVVVSADNRVKMKKKRKNRQIPRSC